MVCPALRVDQQWSSVLQSVLGELVEGFPGCFHYLDDIVIAGLTEEEHDLNLAKFLELASTAGIHFNTSKSPSNKTSLTFLGHEILQGTIKQVTSYTGLRYS